MAPTKIRPCHHCGNQIPKDRRTYCSIECQLWSRVIIKGPNDCWLWTGPTIVGYGSLRVGGGKNGQNYRTHRLAWEIYHGRKMSEGMFACHSCDVKNCVNPLHIFEGTPKDNTHDMIKKGRNKQGEQACGSSSKVAKISEADAIAILADGRPYKDIAKHYGISKTNVISIKTGNSWKHLQRQCLIVAPPRKKGDYSRLHLTTLTEDKVRAIRDDQRTGNEIAKDYGIPPQRVSKIKRREIWKWVK